MADYSKVTLKELIQMGFAGNLEARSEFERRWEIPFERVEEDARKARDRK